MTDIYIYINRLQLKCYSWHTVALTIRMWKQNHFLNGKLGLLFCEGGSSQSEYNRVRAKIFYFLFWSNFEVHRKWPCLSVCFWDWRRCLPERCHPYYGCTKSPIDCRRLVQMKTIQWKSKEYSVPLTGTSMTECRWISKYLAEFVSLNYLQELFCWLKATYTFYTKKRLCLP